MMTDWIIVSTIGIVWNSDEYRLSRSQSKHPPRRFYDKSKYWNIFDKSVCFGNRRIIPYFDYNLTKFFNSYFILLWIINIKFEENRIWVHNFRGWLMQFELFWIGLRHKRKIWAFFLTWMTSPASRKAKKTNVKNFFEPLSNFPNINSSSLLWIFSYVVNHHIGKNSTGDVSRKSYFLEVMNSWFGTTETSEIICFLETIL